MTVVELRSSIDFYIQMNILEWYFEVEGHYYLAHSDREAKPVLKNYVIATNSVIAPVQAALHKLPPS